MIVEARSLLLADARARVRFAVEMTSVEPLPTTEPLRTHWHLGRARLAARLLVEALDLLRIAETKR